MITQEAIQDAADAHPGYWGVPVREYIVLDYRVVAKHDLSTHEQDTLVELIRHGCPVGPKVFDKIYGQTDEGYIDARESYFTKNKFFNQIFDTALYAENFRLLVEMQGDREVDVGSVGIEELTRPEYFEGNDIIPKRLSGIEKPEIYLITQALKNAEYIADGKMGPELPENVRQMYKLEMVDIIDIVQEAEDLTSMTTDIAVRMTERLNENGLFNDEIAKFITSAFSIRGPLFEHGELERMRDIAKSIYESVAHNSGIDSQDSMDIALQMQRIFQEQIDLYIVARDTMSDV